MEHTKQTGYRAIGYLAEQYCGVTLPLQVLRSGAGWYLGTIGGSEELLPEVARIKQDPDILPGEPVSRESEYFLTQEAAEEALRTGRWTQRATP